MDCFTYETKNATPLHFIDKKNLDSWLKKQPSRIQRWIKSVNFAADSGSFCLIPGSNGDLESVVMGFDPNSFWNGGQLPLMLPEGDYALSEFKESYAIAWALGAYQFSAYKTPLRKCARLVIPKNQDALLNIIESIYFVRDLINIPTDDLGPSELADIALDLASEFKAKTTQIVGDDLLKENYPAIHAVGRASDDEPRLIDIRWGNKKHPKLTLVGKGVCFDTGGLDIKPSSAMLLMKKDMGGAAHALGLARMIMANELPVNLRVLIPMVENSIASNSYRPGDVIRSRKGLTIEIGNTDAEGRVILADALAEACEDKPDLLIDMATLTGAARVALGTDLPALFSNQDKIAEEIIRHGKLQNDPVWQMPLFEAYRDSIASQIADINNAGADSYGGAITAALFLKSFVNDEVPWVHFDLMAWNLRNRPGRPQGGEALALRALFSYLSERFQ